MILIHILFYFFLTTPSLSGFLGSPGPNSVTLSGARPVGGPSQALKGENAALGSGRALRLSNGSPSRGSAQSCPAREPRRPQPGLSATPAPPAPAQKAAALRPSPGGEGPGGRAARAPNSPWPKSHRRAHSPESHGAGNARCPGDANWAPRPVP